MCPGVLDDVGDPFQFRDHQDRVTDHVVGQPPAHQYLTDQVSDPPDGRVDRWPHPLRAPWLGNRCKSHVTTAPVRTSVRRGTQVPLYLDGKTRWLIGALTGAGG